MSTPNDPVLSANLTLPPECQRRVAELLASGRRCLLGIVGAPGAGKSTLSQAIGRQWPGQVQEVAMDGFHLANSELERLGRRQRKGAPDTFDAAGYVQLLQRIKTQKGGDLPIYASEFRRAIDEAVAGAVAVQCDTPLIITEGNYLLLDDAPWHQVAGVLDEVWFVNVPDELRRARLVARHMQFGRSAQQARDWVMQTDEPNAVRIAATRTRADLQVSWDR